MIRRSIVCGGAHRDGSWYETVVSLIGNTTNRRGLVVRARLDRRRYATGKKVSKKDVIDYQEALSPI